MSIAAIVMVLVTSSLAGLLLYGTYRFYVDPEDKLPSLIGPAPVGMQKQSKMRPKSKPSSNTIGAQPLAFD